MYTVGFEDNCVVLQEKLFSGRVHIFFVLPLKLAKLGVHDALLDADKLHCEARAYFLDVSTLLSLNHVAVVSEEYEVTLIVHGDDTPPVEVRGLREQRGQRTTNSQSKAGGKVVEDQLGRV